MTRSWTSCDAGGEFHMPRGWGVIGTKKQMDYIMEPRDLQFKTWYLNKHWLVNWDHYLVVVTIEGHKLMVL